MFHQSAELGFTPTQFLTYIIERSLSKFSKVVSLIESPFVMDEGSKVNFSNITKYGFPTVNSPNSKKRIGILMGGISSERHISMESGRNIFDKLAASTDYEPIPIFLTTGDNEGKGTSTHKLFILPINIMLKENADDIKKYLLNHTLNDASSTNDIKKILNHIRDNFNIGDNSVKTMF